MTLKLRVTDYSGWKNDVFPPAGQKGCKLL